MRYRLMTLLALMVGLHALGQTNTISIADFEIYPDSVIAVPVILDNDDETRGCQFNITLPQGLQVVGHELTDFSHDYRMRLTFGQNAADDCYTVILFPSDRTCFPAGTEAIMTLSFKASGDFKGGRVALWKERGSTVENKTIVMNDTVTMVTVPESVLNGIPIDMQQTFNTGM